MEYRILGPLEVLDEGRPLSLGGARQRELLACLLLHANEVVSTDRLLDELWGEHSPQSGAKAVQVAVSQLRKVLHETRSGNETLATRAPGYVLHVRPGELDRDHFESLVARAATTDDAAARAAILREALSLWRGPPLADVTYAPFAQPAIAGLVEARLSALEDRIEADLAMGEGATLVAELEELVAHHPLRERLRAQLMLALYRSGRQADALEAYQDGRRRLVDELGVEPGPELRTLQKQILEQDPSLAAAPEARRRATAAPASRRRLGRWVALAGLAAVTGVLLVALAFARRDDARPVVVRANSVAVIDARSGDVVDAIPVGESPGPIAAGRDSLWVVNVNERTLMKIDMAARSVVGSVAVPVSTGRNIPMLRLALAGDDVWVWACHLTLYRVDPRSTQIIQELEVFRDRGAFSGFSCAIAAEPGSVWVPIDLPRELVHVEAPAGRLASVSDRISAPPGFRSGMTLGAGSIWLADRSGGAVRRVDPATGDVIRTINLGEGPSALAFGHGALWVANDTEDSVVRIAPRTNSVVRAISVGSDPAGLAVGPDAIWVANSGDGTVSRIDPETNNVTETIHVGERPLGVAVSDGLVWVSVRS